MNSVRNNYIKALQVWEDFSDNERHTAQMMIADLHDVKKEIKQKALLLGYVKFCKASIATCQGECCRFHFPKTFTKIEFLAIFGSLTQMEREDLSLQILENRSQKGRCVMLMPRGCFLSFKSRPMVCTNAYPCFASRKYWEFKEACNRKAKPIFEGLNDLLSIGHHKTE